MTAAASQGLIFRWDMDNGLTEIDRYLYSNDEYIKVKKFFSVSLYILTHFWSVIIRFARFF